MDFGFSRQHLKILVIKCCIFLSQNLLHQNALCITTHTDLFYQKSSREDFLNENYINEMLIIYNIPKIKLKKLLVSETFLMCPNVPEYITNFKTEGVLGICYDGNKLLVYASI